MTARQLMPVTADPHPDPSRRGVLRAAALSGAAAALLAACGGSDEGDAATTPSASEGDTATGDDSGGRALVGTAEVPVGSGVILESEKVVVTQLTEGNFKALTAVCTHRQCTVSSIKKDRISCACHGSAFSAEDGSVLNGPATQPLKEIAVKVEGDQVVET